MLTLTYLLAKAAFGSRALDGCHHQVLGLGAGAAPGAGGSFLGSPCTGLCDAQGTWGKLRGACGVSCLCSVCVPLPCVPPSAPAQEFENAEGDDYVTEFSAQGSPAPQHGPEVYILPLTEVSLPMAKQPGRSGKPRGGHRDPPVRPDPAPPCRGVGTGGVTPAKGFNQRVYLAKGFSQSSSWAGGGCRGPSAQGSTPNPLLAPRGAVCIPSGVQRDTECPIPCHPPAPALRKQGSEWERNPGGAGGGLGPLCHSPLAPIVALPSSENGSSVMGPARCGAAQRSPTMAPLLHPLAWVPGGAGPAPGGGRELGGG